MIPALRNGVLQTRDIGICWCGHSAAMDLRMPWKLVTVINEVVIWAGVRAGPAGGWRSATGLLPRIDNTRIKPFMKFTMAIRKANGADVDMPHRRGVIPQEAGTVDPIHRPCSYIVSAPIPDFH